MCRKAKRRHKKHQRLSKKVHSVFKDKVNQIPKIIDEAWKIKGMPLAKDPAAYVVPMNRVIGQGGQTSLKMIVKPGTSEIITAYPF